MSNPVALASVNLKPSTFEEFKEVVTLLVCPRGAHLFNPEPRKGAFHSHATFFLYRGTLDFEIEFSFESETWSVSAKPNHCGRAFFHINKSGIPADISLADEVDSLVTPFLSLFEEIRGLSRKNFNFSPPTED